MRIHTLKRRKDLIAITVEKALSISTAIPSSATFQGFWGSSRRPDFAARLGTSQGHSKGSITRPYLDPPSEPTSGFLEAAMPQILSAVIVMISTYGSSYVTTVTTRTIEKVATQRLATSSTSIVPNQRTWKAREIQRLGQMPLYSDDPAPGRVEACITRLNNRVGYLPGEEDVLVSEEEDTLLKDIRQYG